MSEYTDALLKAAESQLGYGETAGGLTKFGQWYETTHAKEPGFSTAAWCDMFVSWAASQVGQQEDVGQHAWTVDHAKWFKSHGAWGGKPMPGAVVFFDWDGSDDIDAIDHVGLVKNVINGTTVKTIEGNIENAVVSKTRTHDTIVGYGYPEAVRTTNQRKIALARKKNGSNQEHPTGTETVTSTGTAVDSGPADQIGDPMAMGGLVVPAVILLALVKKSRVRDRLTKLIPSLPPIRRDDSG